jgi:hypothetical protein
MARMSRYSPGTFPGQTVVGSSDVFVMLRVW